MYSTFVMFKQNDINLFTEKLISYGMIRKEYAEIVT